jgi:signal transduction histidine kinase
MSVAAAAKPRRIGSDPVEALVAVLVGVITLIGAISSSINEDQPLVVVAAVFVIVPLAFHRRRPYEALAVIVLAGLAVEPGSLPNELPAAVVLFTIAARRGWRPAAFATAAIVLARNADKLLWDETPNLGDSLSTAVLCGAAVAFGLYVGARRAAMDALRERAERMDRERELLAARAVAEERVRIAQELHDVVAHNVSLIVVQAQALGATAGDERVTQATDGIADLGRQTMTEMHRTLQLLRAGDADGPDLAPPPGLAALDGLLERTRAAGVDVSLSIEGEPRPLPQTLDLSAYRIVQEALTNVLKHAGGAAASVTVAYRLDAIALTITDSGEAAPAPSNGSAGGHGLVGMRERAALFGGTLKAGPREGRGFEVDAVLPYPRP